MANKYLDPFPFFGARNAGTIVSMVIRKNVMQWLVGRHAVHTVPPMNGYAFHSSIIAHSEYVLGSCHRRAHECLSSQRIKGESERDIVRKIVPSSGDAPLNLFHGAPLSERLDQTLFEFAVADWPTPVD